ncbi:MAG: homoserine O-acetyltransferase [Candidatus Mariimomonas ferrooxydans]
MEIRGDNMIGPGKGIDTDQFYVLCTNILGGCQGSTGPSSVNPATGKPYGSAFPEITIGDMVKAQKLLLDNMGIEQLHGVIGGSAGGLQVLEWAVSYPTLVKRVTCIASAESLSAQALSFDIIARKIIMADPSWNGGDYYDQGLPEKGLSLARMIGHITYLSKESMDRKFGRERREDIKSDVFNTDFQIESYLNYQGSSFVDRFDANSFLHITAAMNSFSVAERAESLGAAFEKSTARFLFIAVSSDWLYPIEQSLELAETLLQTGKQVTYYNLKAPYGHDSFLIENAELSGMIGSFFDNDQTIPAEAEDKVIQKEYETVSKLIDEPGRVLDLGCGDGTFLKKLQDERGLIGHGVDIDTASLIECSRKGISTFQFDLDEDVRLIPDDSYDYAVLNRTLLEVHKPHQLLHEILRIAKQGIISFANFGHWKHRLRLGLKGVLPQSGALPYDWYDTPNIHFLTLNDFKTFCRKNNIDIIKILCIPDGLVGSLFKGCGFCNLGADRVIAKIARGDGSGKTSDPCKQRK